MYCQNCGEKLEDGASVCLKCGCPVLDDLPVSSKNDVSQDKSKSHVIAGLLALFLGSFGIHKFYLKGYASGVLFILFCWTGFPLLVSLAEALMYFFCPQDQFENRYGY